MRVNDTGSGYGWISIALHWLAAIIVLAMFVIGTMSQGATPEHHVLAVFKHTVLNRDGTFDKIMIADGGRNDRLVVGTDKAKA